jgi:hypothetical protein
VEEQLVHWTDAQWNKASVAFHGAIKAAYEIFDKHAFRKSTGYQRRKPVNRGLFEAQLAVCSALSDQEIRSLTLNRDLVEQKFDRALKNNNEFSGALLYATGSSSSSNSRIAFLTSMFKEILNDR